MSGASAVSHDVYATVIRKGQASSHDELRVSRITVVVLALLAIALGIAFEKVNVAFMVSLAFALAASGNFPVLILSLFWKGCTTRGVVVGGTVGVLLALVLTILSKSSGRRPAQCEGDLHLHVADHLSPCRPPS